MQNYLEVDGRTYYSFEEPAFIGPRLEERIAEDSGFRLPILNLPNRLAVLPKRRKMDWAFGVILPAICFGLDPFIFTPGGLSDEMLGFSVRGFVYVLSFSAVMGTLAWLLFGSSLRSALPFLSGLLAVSSLASFAIGAAMFPLSLLGLLIVIGVLGFTPLASSGIFLRTSIEAFRASPPAMNRITAWHSFALGALTSLVLPFLANHYWD